MDSLRVDYVVGVFETGGEGKLCCLERGDGEEGRGSVSIHMSDVAVPGGAAVAAAAHFSGIELN